MQEFWDRIVNFFKGVGVNFLYGLVILVVGLIAVKIIKTVIRAIFKRRKKDEAMTHFVVSLIDVILKIVVFVSALATMGVNTTSIITVLGTCGVAIGLALKDSLGNLASGILIIFNKPFKKDDYIEAGGVSGSVQEINLFNTTLLTPDNKLIVLPNSVTSGSAIINYNASDIRRLDIDVMLAKGTDLDTVREILSGVVEKSEYRLEEINYEIFLTTQTVGYVVLQLRIWVKSDTFWDAKFALNESVYNATKEAGFLPPNPATDVSLIK